MRKHLHRGGLGLWATACLLWFTAAGCNRHPEPAPTRPPPTSAAEVARIRAALQTYAELAHALYAESSERARQLHRVADEFLMAPTEANLSRTREAWLAARVPYRQTEVFRFYDGPIDSVEMEVNTWPIDEGYVEQQAGGSAPGIVDDVSRYPRLTLELLSQLNGKDGETSISTGYHVVEYLLWGADHQAEGPGERPATDYVGEAGSVAARRGQYLRLAIENLAQNLERVRDAWAPGPPDNYRVQFLSQTPEAALARVLKGMGTLSGAELAGERMIVAFETKSQENEHSCFSDSTTEDLVGNGLGLLNVCQGIYERDGKRVVDGPGLCEAIAARDAALATRLQAELKQSLRELRAIPSPFDQAIQGSDSAAGRRSVWRAIKAVEQQAATLAEVASSYDLRVVRATNADAP